MFSARLKFTKLFQYAAISRSIVSSPTLLTQDAKFPCDIQVSPTENQIGRQIKSVTNIMELLDMMSMLKKQELEPEHLVEALNQIHSLQKTGQTSFTLSEILNHDGFKNMCHILKFKAPLMTTQDLLNSLKVLNYFGFSGGLITERLLDLIKNQINEFTPNQLLFLHFLLGRVPKSPLNEALKIAIPVVFNMSLSLKLDPNNTTELSQLLHYISLSRMKIPPSSLKHIISALTLHGERLELPQAKSVVWTIASMRPFKEDYVQLLDDSMKVLNSQINEMTFNDIETTMEKFNARITKGDRIFFNEEFYNNSAKFVIEKDMGFLNASYLLKHFNNITFVNYDLLDYIDKTAVENHTTISSCKAFPLMSIVTGFSNANYKSENWELIKSLIHENPVLHADKALNLPWIRFALNLMALDIQSNILYSKIFNAEYLEELLSEKKRANEYINLLILWQSLTLLVPKYEGPQPPQNIIDEAIWRNTRMNKTKLEHEHVLEVLGQIFGGTKFIQTNLATDKGHRLDYLISFDKDENPIDMPCKVQKWCELPKSQVRSVAIFLQDEEEFPINLPGKIRGSYHLQQKTLAALDIKAVYITPEIWNHDVRHRYIEREIRYALKSE